MNNSFFNQLKNALNKAPQHPVEDDMWADMEARLHPPKRRALGAWWWLLLLLLPISVFGVYFMWNIGANRVGDKEEILAIETTALPSILEEKSTTNITEITSNISEELDEENRNLNQYSTIIEHPVSSLKTTGNKKINIEEEATENETEACDCPDGNVLQGADNHLFNNVERLNESDLNSNVSSAEKEQKNASNKTKKEVKNKPIALLDLPFVITENNPFVSLDFINVFALENKPKSINVVKQKTNKIGLTFGGQIANSKTKNYSPNINVKASWQVGAEGIFSIKKDLAIRGALQVQHRYIDEYWTMGNPDFILGERAVEDYVLVRQEAKQTWLAPEVSLLYRPQISRRIYPHIGAGIRGEIMLRDARIYHYETAIYPTGGAPFSVNETVKNPFLKLPYATLDVGLEVVLYQKISVFGQTQRLFAFDKNNLANFDWSFRVGVLYAL